jgi:septal ring factor EnvC (AmiA/AmiB activator)
MFRYFVAAWALVFGLTMLALSAFAGERELQQCTLDLQQQKIHTSVVGQTREAVEKELAKALRANAELSQEYDKIALHVQDLNKKIAELEKASPGREGKEKMVPAFEKDPGVK